MKKNVVWWPAIKNPAHKDKFGGYNYFEATKKSWQYWCNKHDVLFVEFTEPIEDDLVEFRANWQKAIFVFDELERREIEYDQILLIDSNILIRWDCPNLFDLTDRKFTAARDVDNMRWTWESVQGYKEFFNGFDFDFNKYFNSGFIFFNESHREVFNSFKDFYYKNRQELIHLQENVVKRGFEQTCMNYWMQINNVDINLDIPVIYRMSHMHRKEVFGNNWQLNENLTPHFIKHSYVWMYNGTPKDSRTSMINQTWDLVKHHYTPNPIDDVLEIVAHKDKYKNATSKKFKKDLHNFLSKKSIKTAVEFGCCQGDTTKVLSLSCNKIYASDISEENVNIAKRKCGGDPNIIFEVKDINTEWPYENPDLIYLDALHDTGGIQNGLDRVRNQYPNSIIVMDDYGHIMNTVKPIIDHLIKNDLIEVLKWIGEDKGYKAANDKTFIDKEGLIFKFKN